MTVTKSMFASKGVWGSVLAIVGVALPVVLKLAGLDDKIAADDVMNLIGQGVTLVGAALALYGRVTATKAIA